MFKPNGNVYLCLAAARNLPDDNLEMGIFIFYYDKLLSRFILKVIVKNFHYKDLSKYLSRVEKISDTKNKRVKIRINETRSEEKHYNFKIVKTFLT